MASKTIMVRKEIYDMMKSNKRPDESFSDYLDRLHRKNGDIEEFFGAWSDIPKEEIDRMLKDIERGRKRAGKSRPRVEFR